jgi:hypothetical protein
MVVRGDEPAKTLSERRPTGARQWKARLRVRVPDAPDGYPALQRIYGIAFAEDPHDGPRAPLSALADRQIDVAAGSVTDGLIEAMGSASSPTTGTPFPRTRPRRSRGRTRSHAHPGLRDALTALGGTIDAGRECAA